MNRALKDEKAGEGGEGDRVVIGRENNLWESSRQEECGAKKAESRSFRALEATYGI